MLYTAAELGALDNDAVGPGERRRHDRQSPRPNVHAPFTRKVERGGILQELDRSQPGHCDPQRPMSFRWSVSLFCDAAER